MNHLSATLISWAALLATPAAFAQAPAGAPDSATHSKPAVRTVYIPTTARAPFDYQRYTWDVSFDMGFLIPSFYQVNNYGYNYLPTTGFGSSWQGYGSAGAFNVNRATSLMFRRNETVVNRTNIPLRKGAYRFTVSLTGGTEHQQTDSLRLTPNSYYELLIPSSSNSFGIGASAGYEWQQQLGRFQLY